MSRGNEPASECILFPGAKSSTGYGVKWSSGRMIGAHRLAYAEVNGEIPDGAMVLHSCDNKACINPKHLRLGTAKENAADAVARGLIASGARHGMNTCPNSRRVGVNATTALLSQEGVDTARAMRRAGSKLWQIAEALGISISAASRVCRGDTYALIAALENTK